MKRAVALFLIVAVAVAAFAQQGAKDEEIRKVLRTRTITLAFSDTPVRDVLSFLSDVTQLNIVIDPKCDSEATITLRLRDIELKNALQLILDQAGLDYIIKKGVIFISTKEIVAEMRGKGKKGESTDLEAGQFLFMLKDGSKLKGRIKIDTWKLKTAYGELTIPTSEIRRIRFPHKGEKAPEEDEVQTIHFTVTGNLEIDKLELETAHGKFALPKSKIKEIVFPQPVITKSFELKPTGKWLDTDIMLLKGYRLKFTAEGSFEMQYVRASGRGAIFILDRATFTPDGKISPDGDDSEGCPLVGKIGESGKEFKIGASYEAKVEQEGKLYLRIRIPSSSIRRSAEKAKGLYKVKVRHEGRSISKPTEAQEMAASRLLGKARAFDAANPYEDRKIVGAMYKEVMEKYPGTEAAKEAARKYKQIMQRRR